MLKVKELPVADRPREKLILHGTQSLTDAELLAVLLRTGKVGKSVITISQELLLKYGNLATLASKTVPSLIQTHLMGKVQAATLQAAFEISRRIQSQSKWFAKNKITSPKDIADVFIPLLIDDVKEKFMIICLNSANKIIKFEVVSIGNLNSSIVHPREIFKIAIENSSASIILLHNHPSGNAEPSNEDVQITKKLVESGKILDIPIFDHLIIAGNSYTSFVERRLM